MSRCTEYVPTIVDDLHGSGGAARPNRHIVSSMGNGGLWTLCGQFLPLKRLRVVSRDPREGNIRVREETRYVEMWEADECHRGCAQTHMRNKTRYRIGSGLWNWLWQPSRAALRPTPAQNSGTPMARRAAMKAAGIKPGGPTRASWWKRLRRFGRVA